VAEIAYLLARAAHEHTDRPSASQLRCQRIDLNRPAELQAHVTERCPLRAAAPICRDVEAHPTVGHRQRLATERFTVHHHAHSLLRDQCSRAEPELGGSRAKGQQHPHLPALRDHPAAGFLRTRRSSFAVAYRTPSLAEHETTLIRTQPVDRGRGPLRHPVQRKVALFRNHAKRQQVFRDSLCLGSQLVPVHHDVPDVGERGPCGGLLAIGGGHRLGGQGCTQRVVLGDICSVRHGDQPRQHRLLIEVLELVLRVA